MNLKEITDLIQIRQYLASSISNFNIDKATVNDLGRLLVLIDKKVINIIKGDEFKSYIGQVEEQVEVPIKSGIRK